MTKVVGVRLKKGRRIYLFSPGDLRVNPHDAVIVETSRGQEYGYVVIAEHEDPNVNESLKEVIRLATPEDTLHQEENEKKELDALVICLDKIKKHNLGMKLIDCNITFDNTKMLFYFTADGRVDFRELVKDLASEFHTRIELRQEGVRDEAKTLGGLGSCGRELCCHSFLSAFTHVSIRMAKNQNLSLNTSKISGVCGRLLCCLNYEEAVYEELNKLLPMVGDYAQTPDGLSGVVSSVNTLKQQVKVLVDLPGDAKELREYAAGEISFKSRKKSTQPRDQVISEEEDMEAADAEDTIEASPDEQEHFEEDEGKSSNEQLFFEEETFEEIQET